jgi:hypothetical protein
MIRRSHHAGSARQRLLPGLSFACVMMLMLAACDANETLAPTAPVAAPSHDYVYTYGTFQLVGSDAWNIIKLSNTHVIGREGGRLSLGLDELIVPAGAVSAPTVFKMTRQLGPHILVDLKAYDRQTGAVVDTFARPLELRLSYLFARVPQPERLVVLWLKDESSDGELVPMPTRVSTRTRQVIGSLTHFSQYAMGLN